MVKDLVAVAGKMLALDKETESIRDFIKAANDLTAPGLSPAARLDQLLTLAGQTPLPAGLSPPLAGVVKAFHAINAGVQRSGAAVLLKPYDLFLSGSLAPASCNWPVIAGKGAAAAGPVALSLDGKLGIRLAVNSGPALWTFSDPPADHLIAIGMTAAVNAGVEGKVPFRALTFGIGAAAKAEATIDWFLAPPASRYGEAVGEIIAGELAHLPDPMSLMAVMDRVNQGVLVGLRLKIAGTTSLSGSVSIGFAEELGPGMKLSGNAEIKLSTSLTADYEMSLKAVPGREQGGNDLQIKVNRRKLHTDEIAASLGVTLDLSQLTARFRAILVQKLGLLRAGLEDLTPWLSPGSKALDLFRQEFADLAADLLADNPGLKNAVVQHVDILTGAAEAGVVEAHLSELVASLLDRGGVLGEAAAKDVADAIVARLPQPLQGHGARLKAGLADIITQYRNKLADFLDGLVNKAAGPIDDLLANAGTQIAAEADKVDARLAGVRSLLARLDALAAKIAAEAENPLRQQVKLKVAMAESRWDGSGLQISGRFSAVSPATNAVHAAITRGQFDIVAPLLAGKTVSGFELFADESRLALTAGRKRETSVHAVVFGFGLGFTARDLATADVVIDGFGNIMVGTKAQIERQATGFGIDKSVTFVNLLSIAVVASGSSEIREADLGFVASIQDQRLSRGDVRSLVQQLAPVISGNPGAELERLMDSWFTGRGDKAFMNGAIALRMAVSRPGLMALRTLGDRQISDPGVRETTINAAFAVTRQLHPRWHHDDALAIMRAYGGGRDQTSAARIWLNFRTRQDLNNLNQISNWQGPPLDSPFSGLSGARIDQGDFATVAKALYRAEQVAEVPEVIARSINLAMAVTPETIVATLNKVQDEQQKLVDTVGRLLRINDTVSDWFEVSVSDWTIALLLTVRDLLLAGGAQAPDLFLDLRRSGSDGQIATIRLSIAPPRNDRPL